MTLALGSVLLWLLNLAGAALIAGRGRARWLVGRGNGWHPRRRGDAHLAGPAGSGLPGGCPAPPRHSLRQPRGGSIPCWA